MKRIAINIIVSELLILAFILIAYRKLTLLDYINISFYVGAILIFVGLLILILQSGFFDFFSTSFKRVFYRKQIGEEIETMRSPSEIVTLKASTFLSIGIPVIILMLAALLVYSI